MHKYRLFTVCYLINLQVIIAPIAVNALYLFKQMKLHQSFMFSKKILIEARNCTGKGN